MQTKLQNYFNEEETDRDTTNALIKTMYTGTNERIARQEGECYYSARDDQWYFRSFEISIADNWYRVRPENLKGLMEQ